METIRLDNWAELCCIDASLITVRRRTRMDIEALLPIIHAHSA